MLNSNDEIGSIKLGITTMRPKGLDMVMSRFRSNLSDGWG